MGVGLCAIAFWAGTLGGGKGRALEVKSFEKGGSVGARTSGDEESGKRLQELLEEKGSRYRVLEMRAGVAELGREEMVELWQTAVERLNFSRKRDRELAKVLLMRMAGLDGELMLECAEDLGSWRGEILPEAVGEWGRWDLAGAMALIREAENGVRGASLNAVVKVMGVENPAGALALFLDGKEEGLVHSSADWAPWFFQRWARDDAEAAMRGAREMLERGKDDGGLRAAMTGWATLEPKGALAWLETEGKELKSGLVDRLRLDLIDGWAQKDGKGAAEYLLGQDFGWKYFNAGASALF